MSARAARLARTRGLNVVDASLFKEAQLYYIKEAQTFYKYKGPIRDPDYVEAANNIYHNKEKYKSELSQAIRRFFAM
jgi:hypothetical protein